MSNTTLIDAVDSKIPLSPDEQFKEKIAAHASNKNLRIFNDLGDILQLSPLIVSDILMAAEEFDFEDAKHLMGDIAPGVFPVAIAALLAGGIAACASSYYRTRHLRKELEELKSPAEREAQRQYVLQLLRELEAADYPKADKAEFRAFCDKILRKSRRDETIIKAELAFQNNKFWIFGVGQILLGIAVMTTYIVLGTAAISILSPVISATLTASMAFMAWRFLEKWKEAETNLKNIEADYRDKIGDIDLKIFNLQNTLSGLPDSEKKAAVLEEIATLKQQKNDLSYDCGNEIKCAKADITQRRGKFIAYTLAFTLGLVATALAVTAIVFAAPVVIALAAGFAAAAVLCLAGYWGYQLVQKTIIDNAPKHLDNLRATKPAAFNKNTLTAFSGSMTESPAAATQGSVARPITPPPAYTLNLAEAAESPPSPSITPPPVYH